VSPYVWNGACVCQLEVPLLYYFPPEDRDVTREGRAKSFVYEVRDHPSDPSLQLMEILVNTGHDVGADQLRVEVHTSNQPPLCLAQLLASYTPGRSRRWRDNRSLSEPACSFHRGFSCAAPSVWNKRHLEICSRRFNSLLRGTLRHIFRAFS